MQTKLLLFSSSREGNGTYLQSAAPIIEKFLSNTVLKIAFIPFALVNPDHEAYANNVRTALSAYRYTIQKADYTNAASIIENADAIMVGGGNTFKLLHDIYQLQLMELIKEKVKAGTPYIGWSAGSNIAGGTISTSNDMPIINPGSFNALGFLPFQINPHYYNVPIAGFNGETRNQRLAEFLQLNPQKLVVGLPEGTALLLDQGTLQLTGKGNAFLFSWKEGAFVQEEIKAEDELSFLLK